MALDLVVSVVTKIGGYLVAPVGRQIGYLIFYDGNIKNLEEQVQKLEDKKFGTQQIVNAAKRNNKIIGRDVERWLAKADQRGEEAKKFLEDEVKANKGCLNLKSRYSLSRKAKKKTQDVVELCADGNFPRVSFSAPPPSPERIAPIFTRDFKDFESRRSIMNEVMEALVDDSIYMIGICGMGGVGKTTMVEEVAQKAKENKLFDENAKVVVSQKPDLTKIQGAIAKQLGFESFGGKGASDLRQRILSSKKVLIILDDVWKWLDLNQIGIPFGNDHKGCKIVLTSRSEDVCNRMDTQKKIKVQVLHEEEAWNLFKEAAGIASDVISTTTDLHSTQKVVAKECGDLPIAVLTVGRALNGKEKPSWDDALNQLQRALGKNFVEVDEKVFQSLELSYNYLKSEEAKKLFLLCSLFPEDFRIQIEDLVRFGIGLKLFEGIGTVGTARNRVHALVDDLMKCYLLMDDEKGVSVRMHDVIRDVAISIASRKEHSFMVRFDEALKEWPEEDRQENCTAISMSCTAMHDLPNNLELPNLKLLQLQYNNKLPETPDCFYQGMKELKVVDLTSMNVQSLPASLRCLTNLRTLSLYYCELSGDISVIGALKNLEILCFAGSTMEELPKEIANLTRLKLLDLIGCRVERISPGVLSSLSRLEELYVSTSVPSLSRLQEEGKELEIISDATASITELVSLSNLVALDIHIQFWPKDFVLGKVTKFRISVGGCHFESFDSYMLKNQLKLGGVDASDVMESGIKMLLKSTEILELNGIAGLKNISCDLYKDIFEYLKELRVEDCRDLEFLINTTTNDDDDGVVLQRAFPVLEDLKLSYLNNFKGIICDGRQQLSKKKEVELQNLPQIPHHNKRGGPTQLDWLHNLTSVYMWRCGMVESLFSLSMARGLVQLQTLEIGDCETMESIVCSSEGGGEHETTAAIEFPKLQKLTLEKLSSFIAFCKAVNAIELPQLNELNLIDIPKLRNLCHPASKNNCDTIIRPLFDKGGQLTSIEKLFLSGMENLIEIWPRELKAKLKEMRVGMCHRLLSILFPSNLVECLQNLELLEVKECRSVEVAFDFGGLIVREGPPVVALLSLKYLKLIHLPKLTHVWMNKNSPTEGIQGFNNLTSLTVKGCGSLRNLFSSSSVAKLLVQLQELEITECVAMEAIIAKEQGVDDDDDEVTTTTTNTIIMFPQLTSLKLSALPNLMTFCPQGYTFEGSLLKKVQVINCPKMESLPSQFQKIQALQRSNEGFHEAIQKTDKAPRKFMLTSDGEFTVMEIDDTTELWQNQLEAECLPDVKRMWVQCCGKISSVVSTNLIQKFHNLKQLKVWWCYSVGVIFDLEGVCVEEGTVTQLSEMEFKYLPKLTDIWKINFSQQTHCFQNLRSLKVKTCDSLKYIFTLSMAKVLVNLESLKVGHCEKVEKIVIRDEEEEEEEEEESRTILPKLRKVYSVTLKDLPSLVSFGVPFKSWLMKLQSCPKFQR